MFEVDIVCLRRLTASCCNYGMHYQQPTIPESSTNQPTVCVLCSHNCGLRVDVEDNRITAVRADDTNPITNGYACNKGFSIAHYVEHAQRVEHPLKRQPDGSYARISWDQAVHEIGSKLRQVKDDHGGQSVGLVGVGGQANHLDGSYALALLLGLESPWWFNALAQEKTQHALVDKWLFDAYPTFHFHADVHHSEYALVIGTNPLISNRGIAPREWVAALSDPTRTMVVVDPKETETAKKADMHLAIRPGGDVYFLLAMAATILQEQRYNRAFVERYVDDLATLQAEVGGLDVARLCDLAGLAEDEVRGVARGFAAAESASIFVDLGLEQTRFSTLTAYLMRLIAGLTGNLGNRGGMTFMGLFGAEGPSLRKQEFVAPESGIEAIAMWAPIGAFSYNLVPEEVLADRPDRIRALIVDGANPMLQAADTPAWRRAVDALELLVVIEPAMSETAQVADYVLPAPCGYEKWEYAGFPKGFPGVYAQVRPPVVSGPSEALPEAEIFRRLAHAAGLVTTLPRPLSWLLRRARSPRLAGLALPALAA
ncbi:MAG: molybdopterin-dependent oxidoreductase, partial [Myxococcales bacterium]|nr:molybdopterin-dependent oxidoreductase [Myxococcales bacterium]